MNLCTNSYFRYGFSATPWREASDELEIEAGLAGFICKISPSSLIKVGRLSKPNIYFLDNPPLTQYDGLSWQKQYMRCIVENDYRNSMICYAANELFKRKKTCIIAITHVRHGQILEKMFKYKFPEIRVKFISGAIESQNKQMALKLLDQRKIDVVIATTVFGEGVDVPSLDGIINGKGNASKIEVIQLIGRCLRTTKEKKTATYIDFLDMEHYTRQHSADRWKILDAEEEFEVKRVKDIERLKIELDKQNDGIEMLEDV
jgi:superfamily II DNA or RNA helicase